MKISIIGGGNVGGLAAMRLAQERLGEVILIDVAPGLAKAKAFDMDDARHLLKMNYSVIGTNELRAVEGTDIVVITAGFARKPGMTREDLANKNAVVLKGVCSGIKEYAPDAVVVIVTNPLDLMTYFVSKTLGFKKNRVFGMGSSLDASRFANLIAQELKIPVTDIEPMVIGIHGEGMLPLARFSNIKGVVLDEFLSEDKIKVLIDRTVQRGAEIVALFGSGSAYVAPSAAIADIVKAIAKNELRTITVSACLNGEYGIKDASLGVPCRLGRNGIEQIVELDLSREEKEILFRSADNLKSQYDNITA
ncbi:MAG: malate dehydrogenase [Candidatus Omnitrophica bacterium]|jgi:malate dehydrogenase|nr:malate dehydrogenase [Candidatus Omnitrophota bacterium]